jgi:tRNA pseudouridine55 synthase
MMSNKFTPTVFAINKPESGSSYDCIRSLKRSLVSGFGKIGHFGTLDPFASGLLLVGIAGAARLNDLVHSELPKTYIAYGVLGVETPTGDMTSEVNNSDLSNYLNSVISKFEPEFIEHKLKERFLGEYMQAPHVYSAAKFQGKKLHEWAREGVEIKKPPVKREIYRISVIEYDFPKITIEVTVSSGTYVRTLFSDMANYLGTIGTLEGLFRTQIGDVKVGDYPNEFDPKQSAVDLFKLLPFEILDLNEFQTKLISNGNPLNREKHNLLGLDKNYYWILREDKTPICIATLTNEEIKPHIVFGLN